MMVQMPMKDEDVFEEAEYASQSGSKQVWLFFANLMIKWTPINPVSSFQPDQIVGLEANLSCVKWEGLRIRFHLVDKKDNDKTYSFIHALLQGPPIFV